MAVPSIVNVNAILRIVGKYKRDGLNSTEWLNIGCASRLYLGLDIKTCTLKSDDGKQLKSLGAGTYSDYWYIPLE